MHNIPENNQEENSRNQAGPDPNQREDSDFELLNLPFANYQRLERFQNQSQVAYSKIKDKLEQRFEAFENKNPVWSKENQEKANELLQFEEETLDDLAAELQHFDQNFQEIIDSLPGDPNNYDLTQNRCILEFCEAKQKFEPIIREFEKSRAGALRPYFEKLGISVTPADIGLGQYWMDN